MIFLYKIKTIFLFLAQASVSWILWNIFLFNWLGTLQTKNKYTHIFFNDDRGKILKWEMPDISIQPFQAPTYQNYRQKMNIQIHCIVCENVAMITLSFFFFFFFNRNMKWNGKWQNQKRKESNHLTERVLKNSQSN